MVLFWIFFTVSIIPYVLAIIALIYHDMIYPRK